MLETPSSPSTCEHLSRFNKMLGQPSISEVELSVLLEDDLNIEMFKMLGAYLRSMAADSRWRDADPRHDALPRDQRELEQVLAKEALQHCTNPISLKSLMLYHVHVLKACPQFLHIGPSGRR